MSTTTREPYPTDLTDEQWHVIEPMVPPEKRGGRPREVDIREVVDAILYILRTGCQWRNLPHDFPPWGTVSWYFWLWSNDGTWTRIHDKLREMVREEAGREKEPSAAILDSQSVKTTEVVGGPRGYDAAKKVTGRKRHLLVDTMGLILLVLVHPADVQDRDGAQLLLGAIVGRFSRLQLIWADAGYAANLLVAWMSLTFGTRLRLEIVHRTEEHKFAVVRHR